MNIIAALILLLCAAGILWLVYILIGQAIAGPNRLHPIIGIILLLVFLLIVFSFFDFKKYIGAKAPIPELIA